MQRRWNSLSQQQDWCNPDVWRDVGQPNERLSELRDDLERFSWEAYIKNKELNTGNSEEESACANTERRDSNERDQQK
jgi:hypothetical protein